MHSKNGSHSEVADFEPINRDIFKRRRTLNRELAAARNATQRAAAQAKIDALADEWLREFRASLRREYGEEYWRAERERMARALKITAHQLNLKEPK